MGAMSASSAAAMTSGNPRHAKIARLCCGAYVPNAGPRSASEAIAECTADDPWAERRLRGDELLRADEGAGVRVTQVFTGQSEAPGVLRHANRRIVSGVRRV